MSKLTLNVTPVEKLPDDPEQRAAQASEAIKTLTEAQQPYYDARHKAVVALLEAGQRPADVARTIGVTRAFMSRYKDVQPK